MYAKKSLISLHTFFGGGAVGGVVGLFPALFYDFFLQNPMRIIVLRRIEDAGAV